MERLTALSLLSVSRLCCRCFIRQRCQSTYSALNQNIRYLSAAPADSSFYQLHHFRQPCRYNSTFSSTFLSSTKSWELSTWNPSKLVSTSRLKKLGLRHVSSDSQNFHQPSNKFPFWQRLLFVSGVGAVIYFIFKDAIHEKEIESEQTRYQELGKAALGGDWTLTDHHGNRRSASEFHGQWVLLYFGFTHCPDICPEELEKLIEIVNMFEKDSSQPNIQPLFISVDPERDSPKVIKDYCAEYSPKLIGFTGSEEEIRGVCKKFRVYFGKGERDENNDYIVDHTIIIYLINPQGEFVNYFGRSLAADNVYKSVAEHMARYKELELKGKLDAKKQ